MKNNPMYAVASTMVLCVLCAGVLTFAHTQLAERIEANANLARVTAIMDALGYDVDGASPGEVAELYGRVVTRRQAGEMTVYEARDGNERVAYAFEVVGEGTYGPIKGILAVGPDKKRIKAFRIYEHHETPGLGGKITSQAWLGQFAGKHLVHNGQTGLTVSSKETGPNVVAAITGASKTSYHINRILNRSIAQFLSGGQRREALDILAMPITKATPGYPRNLPRPSHLRQEVRRADFMVPPGVELLSLNRPVTGEPGALLGAEVLEVLTDGDKRCVDGSYVEMLDFGDPQWVQVDLGEPKDLFAIVVWHYYKNPIIYKDVIVRVSNDPDFEQGVTELFNNDHDNSSGLGAGEDTAYFARWWGELVDARGPDGEGTRGRYVRVYTNGAIGSSMGTCFVEISVFGKDAK